MDPNCSFAFCGKWIEQLMVKEIDDDRIVNGAEIENDYYTEINHEKAKEHYIGFVSYMRHDGILIVRLYSEKDS